MKIKKSPIYKSPWCMAAKIAIIEVSDCDDISSLASTFGDTAISLDTTPYFFDGHGEGLELINPSPVFREIQQYGLPGVRSIVGYTINRAELKPGEEKFWAFYLRKIVPACIGSNEKGQQKALRLACIRTLYANEQLIDFISNVVLPGEDLTKPGAMKKLFNGAFSTRTVENDLSELRKEGKNLPRDTTPDSTPSSKVKDNIEDKGQEQEQDKDKGQDQDQEKDDANETPQEQNASLSPRKIFIDPDKEEDNEQTMYQHHINDIINKHIGIQLK